MSRINNRLIFVLTVLTGMAMSGQVLASNGYFAIGHGTKSKGMGGAGFALPQDALASATNPAGLVFLGDRFDIGANALKTSMKETDTSGGTVVFTETNKEKFLVTPFLGYNGKLDPFSSIGVAIYANDGIYAESPLNQLTLDQWFGNFAYAHKIGQNSALGGSLIVAVQEFATNYNGSSAPADTSSGFGLKFGWQGYLGGGVSLGASYQSRIVMSESSKYSAYLANNGELDIPSTYGAGIAWKYGGLALAFDYQRINYSEVDALGNSPQLPVGQGGFGWTNVNIYKLGIQYEFNKWAIRAGLNHGDNPVPANTLDINGTLPVFIQDHLTAGFTVKFSEGSELNVALLYGLEKTVSGGSLVSPGVTIESSQSQYGGEISYGVRF